MKKILIVLMIVMPVLFGVAQRGINPNSTQVRDSSRKGTDSILDRKKSQGVNSEMDNMPNAKPDSTTSKDIPTITPAGKDKMPVMELSDTLNKKK